MVTEPGYSTEPGYPPDLPEAVRAVVVPLAAGDYDEVVRRTGGRGLDAATMARAVAEYPHPPVPPPADAFDDLDAVEVEGCPRPTWDVRFPFYTAAEGQSDLEVVLLFERDEDGRLAPTVYDILVP
jgi:hypothetical protein